MLRRPVTRQATVTRPTGIHVRPSVAIIKIVRQFQAEVRIRYGEREADASDVLAILELHVPCGAEVTLLAEGLDAPQVLEALVKLFAEDFGMAGT